MRKCYHPPHALGMQQHPQHAQQLFTMGKSLLEKSSWGQTDTKRSGSKGLPSTFLKAHKRPTGRGGAVAALPSEISISVPVQIWITPPCSTGGLKTICTDVWPL